MPKYPPKTYVKKDILPEQGYVRLPTVLAYFGVSHNTLRKYPYFPKGFLLTPRTRVWDVSVLREADKKIRESRGQA